MSRNHIPFIDGESLSLGCTIDYDGCAYINTIETAVSAGNESQYDLALEKPGFTRLLEGPGGVIYDTTRITSKDQVASSDTSQGFSKYWSFEKSISKFRVASYMTPPDTSSLFVAVFALSVALVQSVPVGPVVAAPGSEAGAQIVSEDRQTNFDGSFKNSFQTGNGIANDENGYTKPGADGQVAQVIQGSNAYTAPDGQVVQIQYIADENGFQVQGSHLPTPPPVDPVILKSLEYLASLPSTPETPTQYKKY
ncbi:hypothetical protein V9T40_009015 [Parthenolecanium corni]|uniref:Uncharacterized protein n=1 Tax=Parthenolecanium corni TaxID=536013 RepID=A0AAN9TZ03_9HEMI